MMGSEVNPQLSGSKNNAVRQLLYIRIANLNQTESIGNIVNMILGGFSLLTRNAATALSDVARYKNNVSLGSGLARRDGPPKYYFSDVRSLEHSSSHLNSYPPRRIWKQWKLCLAYLDINRLKDVIHPFSL